jgi:hypothetical protein
MTRACVRLLDDDDTADHRALCEGGHRESCVALAKTVIDTDNDAALALHEQACLMGSTDGCKQAGVLLSKRTPDGGELAPRALELYQRAAAMGNRPSGFYVGRRYANGNGVPQDRDAALPWLREACADEWIEACELLATLHRDGHVEPKGLDAGAEHLGGPCRAGNLHACEEWGEFLTPAQMQVGVGDPACVSSEVTDGLRRACEAGRGHACYTLSIRLRVAFFEELDEVGSFDAARAGCAEDIAPACSHAAWHWDHGTTVVDRAEAERALDRACQLNAELCPLVELRSWSLKLHDITGGWL